MNQFRIAYCLSSTKLLQEVTSGDITQQAFTISGLQERGHRLTLLAMNGLAEIVASDNGAPPQSIPLQWSRSRWFRFLANNCWRIQRLLRIPYLNVFSNLRLLDACLQQLSGHDLVYERNSEYTFAYALAARLLGLPYLLFFDADPLLELDYLGIPLTGLLRWRAQQAMRYTFQSANRIICVSTVAKQHLIDQWRVPESKIDVMPNGVDVNLHRPYPDLRTEIRRELKIGLEQPLLIFVGSFFRWHDVASLLHAFAGVLQKHPTAHLLLVGDGTERHAMEEMARHLEIHPYVTFTGKLPHQQIPSLISAADIAVAPYPKTPTEFWGSPMKLFEYLASSTPLVATGVGQLAEVIKDGVNGLLVPPEDVRALTHALNSLVDDPDLRSRLGAQARQDAIALYGWNHYITRLEEIYQQVVNLHAGQAGRAIDFRHEKVSNPR